jgi:uncharacterized protein YjaG (DUF416 family)
MSMKMDIPAGSLTFDMRIRTVLQQIFITANITFVSYVCVTVHPQYEMICDTNLIQQL